MGYFIDTISPGRDNLYTADQICRIVEFLIDNIFVKLEVSEVGERYDG